MGGSLNTPPQAEPVTTGSSNPVTSVLDEFADRTVRDIAEEMSRLRLDNARLEQERQSLVGERDDLESRCHDMTLEITLLRKERAAFKGATRYMIEHTGYVPPAAPRQSKGLSELPHEILLAVLREARAPRHELDPSVIDCKGPSSAWLAELRFRKGLILVSKWWSGPATQLFCEDIVLRRMGQIIALADVFTTQGSLPTLVMSLRLDACIILAHCADVAQEALHSILSLCTALQTFEYHSTEGIPTVTTLPPGDIAGVFNPAWFVDSSVLPFQLAFQERVAGLTVLDMAIPLTHRQVVHLHTLLSSTVRLRTLKTRYVHPGAEAETDHLGPLQALHLPHLTELYIPINDPRFVTYVSGTWKMPSLARLTALYAGKIPDALLKAHGARLRYLHFNPSPMGRLRVDIVLPDIRRVTKLCPLVEHLVLPDEALVRSSSSDPEPPRSALRYVDVWVNLPRTRNIPSELRPWGEERFHPRLLAYGLTRHVDLPAVCDPRTGLGDGGSRTISLPGMRLEWSRDFVDWVREDLSDDLSDNYSDCPSESGDSGSGESGSGSSDEEALSLVLDAEDGAPLPSARSTGGAEKVVEGDYMSEQAEAQEEDEAEHEEDISEHESDNWAPDEQLGWEAVLEMFVRSRDGD